MRGPLAVDAVELPKLNGDVQKPEGCPGLPNKAGWLEVVVPNDGALLPNAEGWPDVVPNAEGALLPNAEGWEDVVVPNDGALLPNAAGWEDVAVPNPDVVELPRGEEVVEDVVDPNEKGLGADPNVVDEATVVPPNPEVEVPNVVEPDDIDEPVLPNVDPVPMLPKVDPEEVPPKVNPPEVLAGVDPKLNVAV